MRSRTGKETIERIATKQRAFFDSGRTLPLRFRESMLRELYRNIRKRERAILDALQADLGKSHMEGFMCEVGLTLSEIRHMLAHLRQYASRRVASTPITSFPARSIVRPEPYGCVLIMSPWNYPFLLTMEPLVDAIAAGNTAVVKPSAYSPATSAVIQEMLSDIFPVGFVAAVTGGREENKALLTMQYDMIFFTGSQTVGQDVLAAAAPRLTPVVLELGGKSPCIVDSTADIALAARRISWGKFLNCGQTCVAPDFILCDSRIKGRLVEALVSEIQRQYGQKPFENKHYGRMVNEKHYRRVLALIEEEKVILGGEGKAETLQIAPTLLDGVTWKDAVMQEEIFGPVLPLLTYDDFDRMIGQLRKQPHPLALYIFSRDRAHIRKATQQIRYGGGCINDVVVHLATSGMPFGGVGASGMGAYHGQDGFLAFSHQKSILDRKAWIDPPMRYQPYRGIYSKLLRMVLR